MISKNAYIIISHLFQDAAKGNMTSLCKYFWELKYKNKTPKFKWKIIKLARTTTSLNETCFLSTGENANN